MPYNACSPTVAVLAVGVQILPIQIIQPIQPMHPTHRHWHQQERHCRRHHRIIHRTTSHRPHRTTARTNRPRLYFIRPYSTPKLNQYTMRICTPRHSVITMNTGVQSVFWIMPDC